MAQSAYTQLVKRRFSNHVKLFTDGSKLGDAVGIGIHGIGNGISLSVPSIYSVFSAEAAAMWLALSRRPKDVALVIFSDSLSVIQALESGESCHPFIQQIENSCDPLVTICWIPGHVGIRGNEEADRLAALGRNVQHSFTNDIPAANIIKNFSRCITNKFSEQWRNSSGHLQKVKGDLSKWVDRNSRIEQRTLSRLRVGHTKVSHAHCISQTLPPHCSTCGTRNTVEHILVNCQLYSDLRRQHNIPLSIRDILSNDPVREEILISFLKDADLYDAL
ncbi:uncharacterized protein LOC131429113 [Malaya genurostris]|uniref:uncharacterized protein LOC131429113 n=1 Tax=Malaya genurostris TaxID=325434 RepID=UPI0026F3ABB8|nr:uncharacterized protein LOC131429113 [Malaya genurostris]